MSHGRSGGADSRGVYAVQAGSARGVLLNVFGEFSLSEEAPSPTTSALVRVLGEVGVGHHAARQAVHRCSQDGLIVGVRSGRDVKWSLTAKWREILSDGIAGVEALGRWPADTEWDSCWLLLVCSVPQERRAVRDRFFRALRWHGFGSPMPGLWMSAHPDRRVQVDATVRRCDLESHAAAFVGRPADIGLCERALVERAWDLTAIAMHYQDLVARFSLVPADTRAGCLRALLELDRELQNAPSWDPNLPSALAPGWSGRRDAAQLLALRARWLGPAREHWRDLQEP